jgi:hypothetical protein
VFALPGKISYIRCDSNGELERELVGRQVPDYDVLLAAIKRYKNKINPPVRFLAVDSKSNSGVGLGVAVQGLNR